MLFRRRRRFSRPVDPILAAIVVVQLQRQGCRSRSQSSAHVAEMIGERLHWNRWGRAKLAFMENVPTPRRMDVHLGDKRGRLTQVEFISNP